MVDPGSANGTVVNGRMDLDSASLVYLPYSFKLSNGKGRLTFKDQDLLIEQFSIRTGSTPIMVKGIAKNLVALLDRNSENVGVDLNLTTPHLDLEDLTGIDPGRARFRNCAPQPRNRQTKALIKRSIEGQSVADKHTEECVES